MEKHKCLDDFYELFEALIDCLEAIATEPDWDSKAKTDASDLLFQITFLCALSYLFGSLFCTCIISSCASLTFSYAVTMSIVLPCKRILKVLVCVQLSILFIWIYEDEFHSIIEKATCSDGRNSRHNHFQAKNGIKRQTLCGEC